MTKKNSAYQTMMNYDEINYDKLYAINYDRLSDTLW